MPAATQQVESEISPHLRAAVVAEVRKGLFNNFSKHLELQQQKTLAPWLFYDAAGSVLFEEITELPEYYLTRTEREIFTAHADEMIAAAAQGSRLSIAELGAGTAAKTGLLLAAAARAQGSVLYQPVDVSPTALAEAKTRLEDSLRGVQVAPQVADYTRGPILFERDSRQLVLYIGSSIGNFDPASAIALLSNLRSQLQPGDALLLGTDMVKDRATLLSAYNDVAGVTAAFNLNVLARLNRELGADFDLRRFRHSAIWNAQCSRIEMHLQSTVHQRVSFPSVGEIELAQGETIHTENSYKFTPEAVAGLLQPADFALERVWTNERKWFAVTLARAA